MRKLWIGLMAISLLLASPLYASDLDTYLLDKYKRGWSQEDQWNLFDYARDDIVALETGVFASLTLGGVELTAWGGSGGSPWEHSGATTVLTSAPTKFIATHSSGQLLVTILDTNDITGTTNDQTIDLSTNNKVIFGDNSDTFTIEFDATDTILQSSDGAIVFKSSQADGEAHFKVENDTDDYLAIQTNSNVPTITTIGSCDLELLSSSGEITFGDENLTTTGTLDAGAATFSSIAGVDTITGTTHGDVLSFAADDVLSFTSDSESSTLAAIGFEAKDAILLLSANESANSGDDWELKSATGNDFTISNDITGSQVAKLTGTTAGSWTIGGDVLTFGDGEYFTNAEDDRIKVASNDSATVFEIWANAASGTATLQLSSNQDAAAGDSWIAQASTSETFIIANDTATADTFVTKVTVAGATGNVTLAGDLDIDGNDLTSAGDLVITPGGGDVDFSVADLQIDGGKKVSLDGSTESNYILYSTTMQLVGSADILIDAAGGDVDIDAANLWLDSGKKLSLDGSTESNYLYLSTNLALIASADVLIDPAGGDVDFDACDVQLDAGKKLSLNGATETDAVYSSTDLQIVAAADVVISPTGGDVDISAADLWIDGAKKMSLDGTTETNYLTFSTSLQMIGSADILIDAAGGDVDIDAADLWIDDGKKVSFDGVTETNYIQLSTNMQMVATADILLDAGGGDIDIDGADLQLDATKKLSLNGATETDVVYSSTDLQIAAAADVVISPTGGQVDFNVADIAVDGGKKIGLNGIAALTNDFLYLSTNVILDAAADIVLDAGGGQVDVDAADICVDSGKKIALNGVAGVANDYLYLSTDVKLSATADIEITAGGGQVDISVSDLAVDSGKKIGLSGITFASDFIWVSTNLVVDSATDIVLDPAGGDIDVDAADLQLDTGKKLSLNGATETDAVYSSTDLQIVSAADIVLTPTGTEVHIVGGLSVGDTTDVGDNNLKVVGTSQLVALSTVVEATATRTITSADYGKTIFYTHAGAVTVTLPAAGEAVGSWFRCVNANSDTTAPTYATPVADNLITFNNATADSVTYGTGHRIGSSTLFISNGSFWVAINESGSNTMTVTDV